ncbi:MAG: 4Fe-4S cluster-binding domain-containing protein, partial [Clostridia bacterium]|nr:4Fe-4S cluster-binding domain-containing protein [Clostridia bacterium]
MNVQGYQKLTLLDYPGRVACTVFTGGCNLRCPFCHNAGLVQTPVAYGSAE